MNERSESLFTISKMQVLVIGEKESLRSAPLVQRLTQNNLVKVEEINASITKNFLDVETLQIRFNQKLAQIFQGRELLAGEVGCADSHNSARARIAKSKIGGIVFEDDARIVNLDCLLEISLTFLMQNYGKAAVLSLAGWNPKKLTRTDACPLSSESPLKPLKLLGIPPLAVGYVLTPQAAQSLLQSNTPIKSVADWPFSNCQFYVSRDPVVYHGDEFTKSLIDSSDSNSRIRSNFQNRLKFFFFMNFFLLNEKQISLTEYCNKVWFRKVYYYLDNIKMRFRT
jgi:Glycosyltransferase family 25 (LPS biosynthesis protein)